MGEGGDRPGRREEARVLLLTPDRRGRRRGGADAVPERERLTMKARECGTFARGGGEVVAARQLQVAAPVQQVADDEVVARPLQVVGVAGGMVSVISATEPGIGRRTVQTGSVTLLFYTIIPLNSISSLACLVLKDQHPNPRVLVFRLFSLLFSRLYP